MRRRKKTTRLTTRRRSSTRGRLRFQRRFDELSCASALNAVRACSPAVGTNPWSSAPRAVSSKYNSYSYLQTPSRPDQPRVSKLAGSSLSQLHSDFLSRPCRPSNQQRHCATELTLLNGAVRRGLRVRQNSPPPLSPPLAVPYHSKSSTFRTGTLSTITMTSPNDMDPSARRDSPRRGAPFTGAAAGELGFTCALGGESEG